MNFAQFIYRSRQFWHAIYDKPAPEDLAEVSQVLTPSQLALFQRMHPGEQAHSIRVYRRIVNERCEVAHEAKRALHVAALLHDVGKICQPLTILERVVIVLGKALFPDLVKRWGVEGEGEIEGSVLSIGWRRPFVVSEQHARWGAELLAEADASPLAVSLILNHQNLFPVKIVSKEDRLLYELQKADQRS
jgi:hypothetical protein